MDNRIEASEESKAIINDLREEIKKSAIEIVFQKMPLKVKLLEDIFKNNKNFNLTLTEIQNSVILEPLQNESQSERATKKRKISEVDESQENGKNVYSTQEIPCNEAIVQMLGVLKKEILDLIEMINSVKIWIQLNIPKIEDGNNFGVSIQEETVSELGRAEEITFAVLENITKYFVARGKLVAKILKYPGVQDFKESVQSLDQKQWTNLRLCCLDLRNNFAILYDLITKNIEKIQKPRSNNPSTMY